MAKYTLLINKETGARSVLVSGTGEQVFEREKPEEYARLRKRALRNARAKERDDCLRASGLTKVRGAVTGKTYWE